MTEEEHQRQKKGGRESAKSVLCRWSRGVWDNTLSYHVPVLQIRKQNSLMVSRAAAFFEGVVNDMCYRLKGKLISSLVMR